MRRWMGQLTIQIYIKWENHSTKLVSSEKLRGHFYKCIFLEIQKAIYLPDKNNNL